MQNITTEIKGNKLVITCDFTEDHGPSKSGKTTIIASSLGNQKVTTPAGEITLGLNLYKKR